MKVEIKNKIWFTLKEIMLINIEYPKLFFVKIEKNKATNKIAKNRLLILTPVTFSSNCESIPITIALRKNIHPYLIVKYFLISSSLMLM